jgi:hypothetical protein
MPFVMEWEGDAATAASLAETGLSAHGFIGVNLMRGECWSNGRV